MGTPDIVVINGECNDNSPRKKSRKVCRGRNCEGNDQYCLILSR